jgi:Protein of unknown function (DUF2934)
MILSKVPKQPKVKSSPASKSAAPETYASHDSVRERAFQIYEGRGSQPGQHTQDWLTAERQIADSQIGSR